MKKLTAAIKAMADEPRLSILMVLALRGAVCVSHLQEAMRTPQPTVSRYLAILRNAGLLEAERKGQWVYYKLNEEEDGLALELVRKYALQLKDSAKIKRIMDRLDKIEQQPSLAPDLEETDKRSQPKGNKRHKRIRRIAVGEKAINADETGLREDGIAAFEDSDAGIAPMDTSETQHAVSAQEAEITAADQAPAAPNEGLATKETELSAEPSKEKKGKREKKPQPPSLFDF